MYICWDILDVSCQGIHVYEGVVDKVENSFVK